MFQINSKTHSGQDNILYINLLLLFSFLYFYLSSAMFDDEIVIALAESRDVAACNKACHCVNSVCIQSICGAYSVQLRENTTRKTPNTDTFYALCKEKINPFLASFPFLY